MSTSFVRRFTCPTVCVQCGQPSTRTVKTPLKLSVRICDSDQCEREVTK